MRSFLHLYFRKRSKRLNENATREETKKSFRANRVGKFNRDCPGKKKWKQINNSWMYAPR